MSHDQVLPHILLLAAHPKPAVEYPKSLCSSGLCKSAMFCFFPYSDGVIQKLQQHYNQSGGPALGVTLSTVQEELSLSPPHVLTMEEIQLSNGVANGHAEHTALSGLSCCSKE